MMQYIELHKRKIPYVLKISKRAKRLRIAIYCDGAFVVTAPKNINISLIEKFIVQKSQWVVDKLNYFNQFPHTLKKENSIEEYLKYKKQALLLVENKVKKFNVIYNFSYNKINIKNQKTRWGSCSKKGNLNFNYKIALLPDRLAEYIVVHELCHLGQFNHSQKFWNLVAKTIPDYLEIRENLKSFQG